MTERASFTVRLAASPSEAFPYFEPANEMQWDPDWHPRLLGDRVEAGLVFLVGEGDDRATWVLDVYDPASHRIGYVAVSSTIATRISIDVRADGGGCVATVVYEKTALGEDAVEMVKHVMRHLPSQAPHWESAIGAAINRRRRADGGRELDV